MFQPEEWIKRFDNNVTQALRNLTYLIEKRDDLTEATIYYISVILVNASQRADLTKEVPTDEIYSCLLLAKTKVSMTQNGSYFKKVYARALLRISILPLTECPFSNFFKNLPRGKAALYLREQYT